MPAEIGLWRVDGPPQRVAAIAMPLESKLEKIIEKDPRILGDPVMLIGRQVPTAFGKFVDLMAVDADGVIHILELKRDRTPREVVAQALDYGSWVRELGHDDVLEIFSTYRPGVAFEAAFSTAFGGSPPEELNTSHRLTVIAGELDATTSRIITYLADFDLPINVLFFRYYVDEGREYVARTWLINDNSPGSNGGGTKKGGTGGGSKEPWDSSSWYVSFGEESGVRVWEDARKYGFVSAGGARWFSRTLRSLPIGARVAAYIPQVGYIGVGEVVGEAQPFEEAVLEVDGQSVPMASLQALQGTYAHAGASDDPHEYVVPVRWIDAVPKENALMKPGLFANQNSACKLRNRFTLEELAKKFHLDEA